MDLNGCQYVVDSSLSLGFRCFRALVHELLQLTSELAIHEVLRSGSVLVEMVNPRAGLLPELVALLPPAVIRGEVNLDHGHKQADWLGSRVVAVVKQPIEKASALKHANTAFAYPRPIHDEDKHTGSAYALVCDFRILVVCGT